MRKEFYKTSEFWQTFIFLGFITLLSGNRGNIGLFAYAIALIVSSYAISRAFYKKNKMSLVVRPYKSSESYFCFFGIVLILFWIFNDRIGLGQGVLSISFILSSLHLSRGIIKNQPFNPGVRL